MNLNPTRIHSLTDPLPKTFRNLMDLLSSSFRNPMNIHPHSFHNLMDLLPRITPTQDRNARICPKIITIKNKAL